MRQVGAVGRVGVFGKVRRGQVGATGRAGVFIKSDR